MEESQQITPEQLQNVVQQVNAYQTRINASTKSGTVDQEAHEKQANLFQDLLSAGVHLERALWYDVEEEKYKLVDEAKKLWGEITGDVQESAKEVETAVASAVPPSQETQTPEPETTSEKNT